jgi:tetratricopeptide (TPR) repeat protein
MAARRGRGWLALLAAGLLLSGVVGLAPAARGAAPPAGLSPAQRARLRERDRHWAQMQARARSGDLAGAIASARRVLALERSLFGNAHEEVADTLELLANLQVARRDFAGARMSRVEVLRVRQRLYGAGDWRVADARQALADLARWERMSPAERTAWMEAGQLNDRTVQLDREGRGMEAVAVARQEVALCRRLLGEAHPRLATSLNNLGSLLQDQGESARPLSLYRQALAMRQRLYPESRYPAGHPDLANSLNNLGSLLQKQRDYAGALGYFRQALAMCQRVYPESRYPQGHPHLAVSLNNLGALLQDQGEYGQALGYYRQALQMKQRLYAAGHPQGHPDLAGSLNNLGALLHDQGDYAGALGYYRQALQMQQRLYPADRYPQGHPDLAAK